MMKSKFFAALSAAALVAAAAFSQPALAHAHLRSQSPAADSAVEAAPQALTLTFSENVEPAFSSVEVVDADGQRVPAGKATVASDARNRLNVALEQPLASGSYRVNWQVLSVDGHKVKGSYGFRVK